MDNQYINKIQLKMVWLPILICLILSGGVYLYTMAPTVTFGDSGDFMTAAYGYRFAHPPGYPSYIILAKAFSLLPMGREIGYRINLLSVLFAAISVALTYLLMYLILKWYVVRDELPDDWVQLSALLSALIFAFNGTFWSQALVAKIHPLNTFYTVSMFILMLLYVRSGELRYWFTAALLFGLSLGNHHTPVLYILPVLFFLWSERKLGEVFQPRHLMTALGCCFLGFSVYLLLPLVSPHISEVEWGRADSFRGFSQIFFRKDYAPFELYRPLEVLYRQIATTVQTLLTGFSTSIPGLLYGLFLLILALFGLITLFHRYRAWAIFSLATAVIIWGFFIFSNNQSMTKQISLETRDVFFIPAYLLYATWVGLGFVGMSMRLAAKRPFAPAWKFQGALVVILVVGTGIFVQFNRHNERDYYLAKDYGRSLLDTMEPNALLVADDDMHLFPVWYLQQVENYRTDVVIVSRSSFYKQWYYDALKAKSLPQFTIPAFTPSEVSKNVEAARTFLDRKMFQFISQNIHQRPCYYYHKYPLRIKPELSITRVGLLYKITAQPLPGTYQHPREYMLNSVAGAADDYLELQYPYLPPPNGYTFRLGNQSVEVRDFWREWAAQRLSDSYLLEALWHQQNEKPDLAERDFIQSLELNPFNYRAHYYRGKLYLGQGKTDAAGNAFIQSAFINGNFQPALEAIDKMKAMTTDAPK